MKGNVVDNVDISDNNIGNNDDGVHHNKVEGGKLPYGDFAKF